MNSHKVFVTDVLNNQTLKKAIGMNADQIVCNEVSLNNETKPDIKILNAEINRIEGTWEAYKFNRPVINSLLSKKNKNFKIDSISLKEALAKILYWTNVRTGALKFTCDAIPEPKTIINDIAFLPGSYWKALIKYFIILTKNNRLYFKRKPVLTTFKSISEIGILVNDEFELNLYQDVIVALGSKPFALFHYGNINFSNINFLSDNIELFDLSLVVNHPIQWPFNPFSVSKNELIASNLIYSNWQMLGSEIRRYGLIKASGIKKLLLNGAENIPERNLMATAFNGSVKVYNTMNGMKSGEAHDADINFEVWFVWDEMMKKMLADTCGIPLNKMIVSGHLSQQRIAEYTYHNIIRINPESLKDKIVISLFSVRGKRQEKLEAFRVLYQYIENNPSVFLIVKPHPLEDPKDYIMPPKGLNNVHFIGNELKMVKEALYDQLLLSDVSVVFGSTVAMESYWMGVPCITFEFKGQSFIYNAGQKGIDHVRTENELLHHIAQIKKKGIIEPSKRIQVAHLIISELC